MKAILTAALTVLALSSGIAPVSAGEQTTIDSLFGSIMTADTTERRRPRVPGGSGCDSPRDVREHPECRR